MVDENVKRTHYRLGRVLEFHLWKRWASEISAGKNGRWKTGKVSSEPVAPVLSGSYLGEEQGRRRWCQSTAIAETRY